MGTFPFPSVNVPLKLTIAGTIPFDDAAACCAMLGRAQVRKAKLTHIRAIQCFINSSLNTIVLRNGFRVTGIRRSDGEVDRSRQTPITPSLPQFKTGNQESSRANSERFAPGSFYNRPCSHCRYGRLFWTGLVPVSIAIYIAPVTRLTPPPPTRFFGQRQKFAFSLRTASPMHPQRFRLAHPLYTLWSKLFLPPRSFDLSATLC